MNLTLQAFDLQLNYTFKIARSARDVQPTLIVVLSDGTYTGYGEAGPNVYYGVTIDKMIEDINQIKQNVIEFDGVAPEVFWKNISPLLKHNSFALCALDIAYNDLFTKRKSMKLYDYWQLNIDNNPKTSYTIAIDTIDKMVSKLKEKPWPIYKIKLGTDQDIEIVRELRKHTNAIFRVDANCAWSAEQAIEYAPILKSLGVEFIEQPLKANDIEGQRTVFENSVLPIIADESCIVESDIQKCHNLFHGVNVKLAKCGGVTPAKRMLEQAKKLGLQTMVGCMIESSVGIAAVSHLLPLLDYVDMDGALLIANDIAKGVQIHDGIVHYSELNGTGVSMKVE